VKTKGVVQAPSLIDGVGAYAAATFGRREKIGELDGVRISLRSAQQIAKTRKRIHIVELNSLVALDASRAVSSLKYVNHSCNPNTYFRIAYRKVSPFHTAESAT